jgi:hypothetical protein
MLREFLRLGLTHAIGRDSLTLFPAGNHGVLRGFRKDLIAIQTALEISASEQIAMRASPFHKTN